MSPQGHRRDLSPAIERRGSLLPAIYSKAWVKGNYLANVKTLCHDRFIASTLVHGGSAAAMGLESTTRLRQSQVRDRNHQATVVTKHVTKATLQQHAGCQVVKWRRLEPIDKYSACVEVGKPIDENPACVEVGTNSV
ncbi:hypothetical protein TNCV_3505281 [Trichonephila clavipes]|uniref:Uncharacterized protein n=1 Tax=Trichonephila clavipes TaxID=2585209 RepID=A0A8X6VCA3_TRICX|nr:hypothetical protein TNCV_3505281 [Trichonephila clavipes]